MRPKSAALLMLAVGCGLVASIGITEVIGKRNGGLTANADTQPIYVATAEIPLGEVLTSEVVQLQQWPRDRIPAGAISRPEDVEGRRARNKFYANEPILESRLLGKGASQQGATGLIPKGYRVVPVKVDLVSGGSSMILPGDRVDVMIHVLRAPEREIPETVTRTILQDIKVFAVNDVVDLEKEKDANGKTITAKTISLLVTPAQAASLMLATQLGVVNLVMRSPEDDQQVADVQARPSELLGQDDKSQRAKESLMVGEDASLSEKTKGFLGFLNSMKAKKTAAAGAAKAPASAAEAAPHETWTVRVLKPGTVEEVQFESAEPATAAASPLGAWRAVSMVGPANAQSANEEPKPPPPPKEEPPKKERAVKKDK